MRFSTPLLRLGSRILDAVQGFEEVVFVAACNH